MKPSTFLSSFAQVVSTLLSFLYTRVEPGAALRKERRVGGDAGMAHHQQGGSTLLVIDSLSQPRRRENKTEVV
jgi:hypothetical protein